jgi:signal peptidase I
MKSVVGFLVGLAFVAAACSTTTVVVVGTTTTSPDSPSISASACLGPLQTLSAAGASMEPTIEIGRAITVDLGAYKTAAPRRGDIVVFATPPGEDAGANVKDLVQRVIGLPGDTISSAEGQVVVNGKPLNEPWLVAGTVTTGITTQKIPTGEYFVMGDNRSDSQDSRFFGPIAASEIVGRAWPSGCNR